uniref:PSI domain-containing protein n=1 Tax=Strongyloides stercoralis TaxID=6248 RepID=A0A0K0E3C3_STRER
MRDYQKVFIYFFLIISLIIYHANSYVASDGVEDENEGLTNERIVKSLEKEVNCSIPNGKENTCKNCLNIDKSCLWCQSTKSCQKFDGLYQNCDYEDSRILHCNLPYTAVIIFFIVLGVVVFIICIVIFCCICSRMDRCARWNRNRIYLRDNLKLKIQKDSILKEQEQRKMDRKARIDELRVKYGIQLSSPTFTRMNSFREKKDQSNI